MKYLALIAIANAALNCACRVDAPPDIAPPITGGKCIANIYKGRKALVQVCNWSGFSWNCGPTDCLRNLETLKEVDDVTKEPDKPKAEIKAGDDAAGPRPTQGTSLVFPWY